MSLKNINTNDLWRGYTTGRIKINDLDDKDVERLVKHGVNIKAIDPGSIDSSVIKKLNLQSTLPKPEPINIQTKSPGFLNSLVDKAKEASSNFLKPTNVEGGLSNYQVGSSINSLKDSYSKNQSPMIDPKLTQNNQTAKNFIDPRLSENDMPNFDSKTSNYLPSSKPKTSNNYLGIDDMSGLKLNKAKPSINVLDTLNKNLPSDSGGTKYEDAITIRESYKDRPPTIDNKVNVKPSVKYDIKGKPIIKDFSTLPNMEEIKAKASEKVSKPKTTTLPEKPKSNTIFAPNMEEIKAKAPQAYEEHKIRAQEKKALGSDGFLESIKEGWKQGKYTVAIGKEGFKEIQGKENQFFELMKEMEQDQELVPKGGTGWFKLALRGAVSQLPLWIEGGKYGAWSALAGAGTAVALGQAGPQIATPEEIITVPLAMFKGYQVGSMYGMSKVLAGLDYREYIESGIDPEIARVIAQGTGVINGLVEHAQVGGVLKSFQKAAGKEATTSALSTMVRRTARRTAYDATRIYGKDVMKGAAQSLARETMEEIVQEIVTMYGRNLGTELHNIKHDDNLEKIAIKEAANRILDTGIESLMTFSILLLPGTSMNLMRTTGKSTLNKVQQSRQIYKVEKALEEINEIAFINPESIFFDRNTHSKYETTKAFVENAIPKINNIDVKNNIRATLAQIEGRKQGYYEASISTAQEWESVEARTQKARKAAQDYIEIFNEENRVSKEQNIERGFEKLDEALEIDVEALFEQRRQEIKEEMAKRNPPIKSAPGTKPQEDIQNQTSPGANINDLQGVSSDVNTNTLESEKVVSSEQIIPPNEEEIVNAPSNTSKVVLENGQELQTEFKVVDAKDLIASSNEDYNINPNYPTELQPRDRTRDASIAQIEMIAQKLNPELLGDNIKAQDGSPIVGPDLVVESGNARTIALKKIMTDPKYKAQRENYINWLMQNLSNFGLESIEGIENPVLVRERLSDMDRAEFTRLANIQSISAMSPVEQAKVDSQKIDSKMIELMETDKFTGSRNSFTNDFFSRVIPENEMNKYVTKDGVLSKQGLERIKNALMFKAYENENILNFFAEDMESNIKNILNAMLENSLNVIKTKEGIKNGSYYDLDISKEIGEASSRFSNIKLLKQSVEEYLNQISIEEKESPLTLEILNIINSRSKSQKAISEFIGTYFNNLKALGNPNQISLTEQESYSHADLLEATLNLLSGENQIDISQVESEGTGLEEQTEISKGRQEEGPQTNEPNQAEQETEAEEVIEETAATPQEVSQQEKNKSPLEKKFQQKLDSLKEQTQINYTISTLDKEIEKLSVFEQKKILEAITGDATDVKVKDGYVEIAYVDNEVDFMFLTKGEYISRYGEQYDDFIIPIEKPDKPLTKLKYLKEFKDENYSYTKVVFYEDEKDIIVRLSGSKLSNIFYKIPDFKDHTASEIIIYNNEFDINLGKHFEDGVMEIWKEKGLDLGFIKKTLKDTAATPQEVSQQETAEVSQEPESELSSNAEVEKEETAEVSQQGSILIEEEAQMKDSIKKLSEYGITLEKTKTTNQVAWNTTGNTYPYKGILSKAGARWYSFEKSWTFYQENNPMEAILENLPSKPAREVEGLNENYDSNISKPVLEFVSKELKEAVQELRKVQETKKSPTVINEYQKTVDMESERIIKNLFGYYMDNKDFFNIAKELNVKDDGYAFANKVTDSFIDFMDRLNLEGISPFSKKAIMDNIEIIDKLWKIKKSKVDLIGNAGNKRTHIEKIAQGWYDKNNNEGGIESETDEGTIGSSPKGTKVDVEIQQGPIQRPSEGGETTGVHGGPGQETGRARGDSPGQSRGTSTQGSPSGENRLPTNDKDTTVGSEDKESDSSGANQAATRRTGEGQNLGKDYIYSEEVLEAIEKRSDKQRLEDNIKALEVLKEIGDATATTPQQEILAKYAGWGNLMNAFIEQDSGAFKGAMQKLKTLMSEKEFKRAKASTLSAFYTPPEIVKSIWEVVKSAGFEKGRILEPSAGIGMFIGNMPKAMQTKSNISMVELDPLTAKIASKLYQSASVRAQGFETTPYPEGFFDVAISNVPFGDINISYKNTSLPIHDFFINKMIDLTREGGLVVAITTHNTLDKKNPKARAMMYEKADLLAAIRMPTSVFDGANVVTDLLIFKKRGPNDDKLDNAWVTSSEFRNGVFSNDYFKENEKKILGTQTTKIGQYGHDIFLEGNFQKDSVAKLIEEFAQKEMNKVYEAFKGEVNQIQENELALKENELIVKDGKTFERRKDKLVEVPRTAKERNAILAVKALVAEIENALNLQKDGATDSEVISSLKALEKSYDAFVKKYGHIHENSLIKAMGKDMDYHKLTILESKSKIKGEKKGQRTKIVFAKNKNFFKGRTVGAIDAIVRTENVEDAINITLGQSGELDLKVLSKVLGQSEEATLKAIEPYTFYDPDKGLVVAGEYLSGDVRKKLQVAKVMSETDSNYDRNVKALEKVIPKDRTIDDISFEFGSTLIPKQIYESFFTKHFGGSLNPEYDSITNSWHFNDVSVSRAAYKYKPEFMSYGRFLDFIIKVMNKEAYVFLTDKKPDPGKIMAAKLKEKELQNDFRTFVRSTQNKEHAKNIEKIYNEKYNSLVKRIYDPNSVTTPGISPDVDLKNAQKIAIARFIQSGNLLMALDVGVGKTYAIIASIMEARRLGRTRKPLLVVPKNKLEDFQNDFLKLYPQANIILLEPESSPTKRAEFWSKATGASEFDAAIISHENLGQLPVSKEREIDFIQRQLDEAELMKLKLSEEDDRNSRFFTDLTKAIERLENKLKELLSLQKDNTFTFEQIGFDLMAIDEAHKFKNLYFATKYSNYSGVAVTDTMRSGDMLMKTEYINEISNNMNILFATATPISNSLSEMFNMLRYLAPHKLKEYGVSTFDEFASIFGELSSKQRINYDQSKFRSQNAFKGLKNADGIVRLFKEFAYFVRAKDDTTLDLPKQNDITVKIPSYPELDTFMKDLAIRAENAGGSGESPLKIFQEGLYAAADLRFVEEKYFELTGETLDVASKGKIYYVTENVYKEYVNSNDIKGTQLIFADYGVTDSNATVYSFPFHQKLKESLVEKGIKESEIVFFKDYKKSLKELYKKVNSGEIRVVIGTTSAMGEGLNIQEKIVAIHHPTVPYRSSDLTQRIGRGVRQGNKNKTVNNYYYVVEGSFDAFSYEMIFTKARQIEQAYYGDEIEKTLDDELAPTAVELAQAALKNPLVAERIKLANELNELLIEKEVFNRALNEESWRYERNARNIERLRNEIEELEIAKEKTKDLNKKLEDEANKPKPKKGETVKEDMLIKVKGKEVDTLKDLMQAVIDEGSKVKYGENNVIIGEVEGFKVHLHTYQDKNTLIMKKEFALEVENQKYYKELSDSVEGMVAKFKNIVKSLQEPADRLKIIKGLEEENSVLEKNKGKEFEGEGRIGEIEARITAIDVELDENSGIEDLGIEIGDDDSSPPSGGEGTTRGYVDPARPSVAHKVNRKVDRNENGALSNFEILRTIREIFGLPVSHQRFRQSKSTRGYYKTNPEAIKIRDYGDYQVLAHEIGHHLSKTYDLQKIFGQREKDLIDFTNMVNPGFLENYSEKKHFEESIAEFIRNYIFNNEETVAQIPGAVLDFESNLLEADRQRFELVAKELNRAYSSERLDRVDTTLHSYASKDATDSVDRKIAKTLFKHYMFDDLATLKEFTENAGLDFRDAANNPYILGLHSRTSSAIVEHMIFREQLDVNHNPIGEPLMDIYNFINVSEYRPFNKYIKLLHAITTDKQIFSYDIYPKGKEGKMLMAIDIERMNASFPHFKGIHERLNSWWDTFMKQWLVESGLIKEELYEKLRERYPYYAPSYRKLEPNNAIRKAMRGITGTKRIGKNSFSDQEFSKRLKGSSLDTYNPMEGYVLALSNIVNATMKNRVMQALVKAYREVDGLGSYFEVVSPAMVRKEISAAEQKFFAVKAILVQNGVKAEIVDELFTMEELLAVAEANNIKDAAIVDAMIDDLLVEYYPKRTESGMFAVARVNGKDIHLQIHDPMLLYSIKHLDSGSINEVLKMLGSIKRAMTIMITGANPIFGLTSNIWSDVQQAMVYSKNKNPVNYLGLVAQSLYQLSFNTEASMEYRRIGGQFMASKVSAEQRSMNSMLDRLIPGKKKEHMTMATFRKILDSIEHLNEVVESAPRMAEFKNYKGETFTEMLYAWYRAQEVTTNFLRKGEINKTAGQVIPFFNAGLQGMYRFTSPVTDKDQKSELLSRIIKSVAFLVLLGILQEALNDDDDDYKDIPNGIKDAYWLIRRGDKFIRIRKPREIGFMFASLPQRIVRHMKGDNEAWKDFASSVRNIFLPPTRTIFGPLNDARANRSWTGYPIENLGMQRKKPSERYDDTTSELAKVFGKALNLSPKKIDYVIRQYSGGLGQVGLPMLTKGEGLTGAWEGIKRRMIIDPLYSNKNVDEFYSNLERMVNAYEYYKDNQVATKYYNERLRKSFQRTSSDISDLNRKIRELRNSERYTQEEKEELIKRYRRQIIDKTKRANQNFDLFIERSKEGKGQ